MVGLCQIFKDIYIDIYGIYSGLQALSSCTDQFRLGLRFKSEDTEKKRDQNKLEFLTYMRFCLFPSAFFLEQ